MYEFEIDVEVVAEDGTIHLVTASIDAEEAIGSAAMLLTPDELAETLAGSVDDQQREAILEALL